MKWIILENHPNDSRVKMGGETVQALTTRMGTGGGNVPMVMEIDDESYAVGCPEQADIYNRWDCSVTVCR